MSLKSIGEKIDELLQTKSSKRGRLDGVTSLKYFHDYMLTNDGPWSFRPPLRGKIIELAFQVSLFHASETLERPISLTRTSHRSSCMLL